MTYYKDITAEYEDIEDRYELMVERIRSITKEETVDMRYRDYFVRTGELYSGRITADKCSTLSGCYA